MRSNIFNWRLRAVRPPIRSQKRKPYCFFHAASVVMEYKFFLRKNWKIHFSDQQLIDKFPYPIRKGIKRRAFFNFMKRHPYVTTKDKYPPNLSPNSYSKKKFKAKQFGEPKYRFKWKMVKAKKRFLVGEENEKIEYVEQYDLPMLRALHQQPLLGFIRATRRFMILKSGVYTRESSLLLQGRHAHSFNHVIAIIGYGTLLNPGAPPQNVWIIQNSHGLRWGDNGIGMIERGKNVGGIERYAYYPMLMEDEDMDYSVRLKKRKRAVKFNYEETSYAPEKRLKKRKRAVKFNYEEALSPVYSEEDLWKQVFAVGTEWDSVYQYNWSFKNMESAFEEGRVLHGKRVYLFSCTEPQMVPFKNEQEKVYIPVIVAVASPIPSSVGRVMEEIIPMKMEWVPYIRLENRMCI